MTEGDFHQRASAFIKQLKNYPQVGVRPFGYPIGAWRMSGVGGLLGTLLQLPLWLLDSFERWQVIAALVGAVFFCCAFTMRVVAFTAAAGGAVDRWLIEQMQALGKPIIANESAEPSAASDRPRD